MGNDPRYYYYYCYLLMMPYIIITCTLLLIKWSQEHVDLSPWTRGHFILTSCTFTIHKAKLPTHPETDALKLEVPSYARYLSLSLFLYHYHSTSCLSRNKAAFHASASSLSRFVQELPLPRSLPTHSITRQCIINKCESLHSKYICNMHC